MYADVKTSITCQVKTRWATLRSWDKTRRIALSCSKILSIILWVEPHRVGDAETRDLTGSFNSCCALLSSLRLFQLWLNAVTISLHTPIAREMRFSSFIAFVMAR